jgi:hypothetical protein
MESWECSFSCMYINAVAKSVMYLQHDFYNTILKITHKLYIAAGSAPPPPPGKILGAHLVVKGRANISSVLTKYKKFHLTYFMLKILSLRSVSTAGTWLFGCV